MPVDHATQQQPINACERLPVLHVVMDPKSPFAALSEFVIATAYGREVQAQYGIDRDGDGYWSTISAKTEGREMLHGVSQWIPQ